MPPLAMNVLNPVIFPKKNIYKDIFFISKRASRMPARHLFSIYRAQFKRRRGFNGINLGRSHPFLDQERLLPQRLGLPAVRLTSAAKNAQRKKEEKCDARHDRSINQTTPKLKALDS